jgi:hypothetical protein
MSALVGALLSYLVETEDAPNRRVFDTMTMAVTCGVAAIGVVGLLAEACGQRACDNPPLLRVVGNSIVVGGILGWCVPSWYRRPQMMITEYMDYTILVALRLKESSVVATVDVEPPRRAARAAQRVRVADDIENASPDDAIADAVRAARSWIDSAGRHVPMAIDSPLLAAAK